VGRKETAVKEAIHPKYEEALIHCTCGNEIKTRSTRSNMHLDVCNVCHPFFTGEQRIVDTAGRVERFNRRYQRPGQ
jgi:large subunit ribosomal protein L31